MKLGQQDSGDIWILSGEEFEIWAIESIGHGGKPSLKR
jgi:hypothetical protein